MLFLTVRSDEIGFVKNLGLALGLDGVPGTTPAPARIRIDTGSKPVKRARHLLSYSAGGANAAIVCPGF
jgi:hypothetical protein